ncbi:MAG: hypothetical protein OXH57_12395 [Ekhidna sp.]|nr:hypothetical protein [Ekhidna sp.]
MKFFNTIINATVLVLLVLNSSFGQEQKSKLEGQDLFNHFSTISLSYSELFKFSKYYPLNQKKIKSFNFLKDYQIEVYNVSKWYVNDNVGATPVPYVIAYYDPVMMYHLSQNHVVIKERRK